MDKAVVRHLEKRGVFASKPSICDIAFSQRNADFFKWFDESVMGFDSEEYYREFWREAYKKGHTIGHRPITARNRVRYMPRRIAGIELLAEFLLCGSAFAIWFMRRMIDRHMQRLRRPTYYETERARRHALAEERRRITKRSTVNSMPDKETLLSAFQKARNSPQDMIRFGSLMEDLECYVDNSPYFKEGRLVGRRGGIRRYLEYNVPELSVRYKTVMRYKALSKRFRQAVGVSDPTPASAVISAGEIKSGSENHVPEVRREFTSDWNDVVAISKRAVETAKAIFDGCEGTAVSLLAQLVVRTDPYFVPKNVLAKKAAMKDDKDCRRRIAGG